MGAVAGASQGLHTVILLPPLGGVRSLVSSVGKVLGVGPGRGIGLQIIVLGILTAEASVLALFVPRIRRVELDLPDAIPGTDGGQSS